MQDHEDDDGQEETSGPDPSPPDEVEVARWWQAYCSMPPPRPWTRLRDIVQAQGKRVRKAVHEGWPELGIPAFKDREIVGDAVVAQLVTKVHAEATSRVVEVVARSWSEDARTHLANLPKLGRAISKLADSLDTIAENASFVAYRKVPDKNADGTPKRDGHGKQVTKLEAYVDGPQFALAVDRLVNAMKEHAVLNKALLDSISPFRSSGIDFSGAPPEVLKWLQEHFLGKKVA